MKPNKIAALLAVVALVGLVGLNFMFIQHQQNQQQQTNVKHNVVYNKQQDQQTKRDVETQDDIINVFIIPHSHCDAGWLLTMQEYYDTQVQYILTNVVVELDKDPNKKFNWAEIGFFDMWWQTQNETTKNKLKNFVANGQWEFVGGGWVQNDEAVTNYDAIIEQLTLGHQWLKNEFNIQPTIGWQIDPFGASSLTPVLFNLANYKYLVIDRADDRLKSVFNSTPVFIEGSGQYQTEQSYEFYWQPSKNYPQVEMFTHMIDVNLYVTPQYCYPNISNVVQLICTGFNWEQDPTVNPTITDQNIQNRSDIFASIIQTRASWNRHNNFLLTFGTDFAFVNATAQFDNMDKLISYINNNTDIYKMKLHYATLSEYFEAVTAIDKNVFPLYTWEDKIDYFPYTRCQNYDYVNFNTCVQYWTGFYSSYPNLKLDVRQHSSLSRAADIMFSLAKPAISGISNEIWQNYGNQILELKKVNGILTHHDAVTGTSRIEVLDDYQQMLTEGAQIAVGALQNITSLLMSQNNYLNISVQFSIPPNPTVGQILPIILYNSLAISRSQIVNISHIPISNFEILDKNGQKVLFQIDDPLPGKEEDLYTLYFSVQLGPLGFTTYFLHIIDQSTTESWNIATNDTESISGQTITLNFEKNQFNQYLLSSYEFFNSYSNIGHNVNLKQQLLYYNGMRDDPYKFRPNATAQPFVDYTNTPVAYFTNGKLVQQFATMLNSGVWQIFRVYFGDENNVQTEYFEIDNYVAVSDNQQMITRFTIDNMETNGIFFTDNGIELIERQWTERYGDNFTWSLISGNYYPVLSTIYIKNETTQLTVLTKQSVGGSSLSDGQLEIMLQRRALGVHPSLNETLNDTSVAYVPLRIMIGLPSLAEQFRPKLSVDFQHPLIPLYAPMQSITPEKFSEIYTTTYSSVQDFPDNLHLVSMETYNNDVILRVVNLDNNQPTGIQIDKFLQNFKIENVNIVTLTATKTISAVDFSSASPVLGPAEIKTFQFQFGSPAPSKKPTNLWIVVGIPVLSVVVVLAVGLGFYFGFWRKRRSQYRPVE